MNVGSERAYWQSVNPSGDRLPFRNASRVFLWGSWVPSVPVAYLGLLRELYEKYGVNVLESRLQSRVTIVTDGIGKEISGCPLYFPIFPFHRRITCDILIFGGFRHV